MKKYREVIEMGFSSERELKRGVKAMYKEQVAKIVDRFGGFREREILKNPHTIEKAGTWNNEHKVLNVSELNPGADGYRGGFQVDLVTMSICG